LREERESEKAAQKVESPKGDANFKRKSKAPAKKAPVVPGGKTAAEA
jgi:hypothetical protein